MILKSSINVWILLLLVAPVSVNAESNGQAFVSKEGDFSIEFPASPTKVTEKKQFNGVDVDQVWYSVTPERKGSASYNVMYFDIPRNECSLREPREHVLFYSEVTKNMVFADQERWIDYENFKGYAIFGRSKVSNNFYSFLLVNNRCRMYSVYIVMPGLENSDEYSKFMSSFRVLSDG